nr:helix-turn-helix domain-containing protein [Polymorphospora rubra]
MTTNPATPTEPTPSTQGRPAWTVERIRALGATTDIATAAAIFGLSRSRAYELARTGHLPVPVLRIGSRYRVSVPAILTTLGVPANHSDRPPPAT